MLFSSCLPFLPFCNLDDDEFQLVINELRNGPVRFNPERFESLNYNPFLLNSNYDLTRSNNIDPDTYLTTNKFSCDYFVENQFNEMLSKNNPINLSLLHLNIRSLQKKINNLSNCLTNSNIQFSIIGISETWLRDDSHSVDIDGYRFIHKNRPNRTGSGVGLFISENLEFKLRPDLCFDNPNIAESLFIEIKKPKVKNIIVGIVYRAPNLHPDDFLSKNTEVPDKISRENKICYLLGDFNLNLINFQTHNPTGEFLDGMYSHMFFL